MTSSASQAAFVRLPVQLLRAAINLVVGTVLCLSPFTAVVVLGWLTRRMAARTDTSLGGPGGQPGWLVGPRNKGWIAWLLGGLAANIQTGLVTAAGLAALTLPFTVLWAGAWWAGWENSFNKGYEQSGVGPVIWLLGAAMAAPVLAHLPMALAHAAFERRFGAFFEWRRIRSVFAAAGWRMALLAFVSVFLCIPVFGLRALPVFVEGIVPGFPAMSPEQQMDIAAAFDLGGAALVFVVVCFLRDRASSIYAFAAPCAARGRAGTFWVGHATARAACRAGEPSRFMAALWLVLSIAIWSVLPVLMVMSQFMNYSSVLWLTHPVFLLPWAG